MKWSLLFSSYTFPICETDENSLFKKWKQAKSVDERKIIAGKIVDACDQAIKDLPKKPWRFWWF